MMSLGSDLKSIISCGKKIFFLVKLCFFPFILYPWIRIHGPKWIWIHTTVCINSEQVKGCRADLFCLMYTLLWQYSYQARNIFRCSELFIHCKFWMIIWWKIIFPENNAKSFVIQLSTKVDYHLVWIIEEYEVYIDGP